MITHHGGFFWFFILGIGWIKLLIFSWSVSPVLELNVVFSGNTTHMGRIWLPIIGCFCIMLWMPVSGSHRLVI